MTTKGKALFAFAALAASVSAANATDVTQVSLPSPETNCGGGTWNVTYYDGQVRYFRDVLIGDAGAAYAIGYASSKVSVYNPNGALSFSGPYTFKSNAKPRELAEVIAIANDSPTTVRAPAGAARGALAAQIVYSIANKRENGTVAGSATYQYLASAGGTTQSVT